MLPDVPQLTEKDMQCCRKTGDFSSVLFEWYKFVGGLCVTFANLLQDSETHTTCPWKGLAHYKDIVSDGEVNSDAAWYYPEPREAAERLGIKNYLAFWNGVEVSE